MVTRKLLIRFLGILLLFSNGLKAQQACSALGQTPSTAFPVCGTNTFQQNTVPLCGGRTVPTPCSDAADYTDINPYWYKFTCFTSGSLGFMITPATNSDDYDWQLFDVTGHNPDDVYTNASLFVCCNWSANSGKTGTKAGASRSVNCSGYSYPNTSAMPNLIQGHNYLLLISHFTSSQSGYSLEFGGGTASITDTTMPLLSKIKPVCDGSQLMLVLNKQMVCSSLATDGSDFTLSVSATPGRQIIGASSSSCATGFDMDTVLLQLDGALAPGDYTVAVKSGSDGNTLLDNCGTAMQEGLNLSFTMKPLQPTPMDSLTPPGCAPDMLQLVFSNAIECSSIAPDGSDFTITGTTPVSISAVNTNCSSSGTTTTVQLQLSAPIQTAGNYVLTLKAGTDGNTIVDQCGLATPPASLTFTTGDTVSAALLTDQIKYGCIRDTIVYDYPSVNGVNSWQWIINGSTDTIRTQDPPPQIYSVFGIKTVQLTVSDGYCTSTVKDTVDLDNGIKARFEAPNIICPTDYAHFLDTSAGKITSWTWEFGDGEVNYDANPPDHLYPVIGMEKVYTILLIVGNGLGCYDTARQQTDVLKSCYIAVPTAFTPNGDGLNDYLYPLNAFKAEGLIFKVYNRNGMMVFQSNDWTKKWDGRVNGDAQPAGTYVWYLEYTDGETNKHVFRKGTTVLIR